MNAHSLFCSLRSEMEKLCVCFYLYVQRFTQTVQYQRHLLIPHRVQIFMDGFAPEHLFTSELELHIWITAA